MYCSTCGSALSLSLSYCHRCGAKVPGELTRPSDVPESLIWAIVSAFVAGIGVIIGLMAVMKNVVGFPHSMIMAISFISFFVLFAIEGVLISTLIGGLRRHKGPSAPIQLADRATRELEEARVQMLNQPLTSVTEGTTRTFQPVYNERKSE